MTPSEVKEQLQQDILTILEGFDMEDIMDEDDYEAMKDKLCNSVITNIDKLDK